MSQQDQSIDEDAPTTLFVPRTSEARDRAPRPLRTESLWDANDVAKYLKVSRSWVYQRAESGLLACIRVGGLVRFDPEKIRACAGAHAEPSRPARSTLRFGKNR
jgi:excisionase family DNA binding protein